MRKTLFAVAAFLCTSLFATPALAVKFGVPDGDEHPYVGLMVAYAEDGTPLWRCTGALLSPTVFLTAAHCVEEPAARVQIWFDEVVTAPPYPTSGGYYGDPYPHPEWTGALTVPSTHDIGIVVLDEPVVGITEFAVLPEPGLLDSLATQRGLQDTTFTVVGYGLQSVKPRLSQLRQRMVGTTHLVNLTSALTDGFNIHLSSNPGHWSGGTCFGDSGGPVLLGDTNIVVGVNSFVLNENCAGAGFAYRVDTLDSLAFINSFL
jgi:hypothetical protein